MKNQFKRGATVRITRGKATQLGVIVAEIERPGPRPELTPRRAVRILMETGKIIERTEGGLLPEMDGDRAKLTQRLAKLV